jgi:Na+/H+ antiporter NhaD/arsenite permease-like protein
MSLLILLVFVVGYACIALEHPLKIDKAASAVLTGVFCWVILVFGQDAMPAFTGAGATTEHVAMDHFLLEHLSNIASILFFLLGAMTIVELIDVHDGFRVITDRIKTTNQVSLLWILSIVTFFLSSVLDNMTTAIIMCALVRRMVKDREQALLMAGFVVIAANAGGAWSPIGDITTIMLWIGGQVTTFNIMKATFVSSLVSMVVPLALVSLRLKGHIERPHSKQDEEADHASRATIFQRNLIFAVGVGSLLFVPVFKTTTHLPPFVGILLGVGVLWTITELMHKRMPTDARHSLTVGAVLRRIDSPSILFFLGILMAVSALETSGHLRMMATSLDGIFGNIYIINTLIGLLSAVVDNVPLVAAMMGMYPMTQYPPDALFWNLLAYCAGTGGSILIIGSAAGVASMGIMHIDFLWYFKRISLYALIGYLAGILMFWLGL